MSKEKSNSIIYKNIYYILMYVIDELREVKLRDLGDEEFKALNDLYAAIISTSMLYVLNSGVLREYNLHNEITTRPKGRLEVAKSIIENKYQKGLILCKRFKLDINNEVNRVIKLAIRILLSYKDSIKDENLNKLKIILSFFNKVADVLPNEVDFRNIDTKDMSVEYKTAYFMSKLIISEYIMKEDGCNKRLIETEDENRMSRIFEKFVRNYYIINYNSRHIWVGSRQFGVMKTVNTIYNRSITDITIENKRNNKVVIIDTKWCKAVLNERNKLSADNQMQIKEYVRDYMEEYGNENTYITGILLYAKPNIELDIESIEKDYLVLGKTEYGMICTKIIDLEKEFDKIKKKLDSIFMEYIA